MILLGTFDFTASIVSSQTLKTTEITKAKYIYIPSRRVNRDTKNRFLIFPDLERDRKFIFSMWGGLDKNHGSFGTIKKIPD